MSILEKICQRICSFLLFIAWYVLLFLLLKYLYMNIFYRYGFEEAVFASFANLTAIFFLLYKKGGSK